MLALNCLVKTAYLGQQGELQSVAQSKVFSTVSQLQKTRLPGLKKGHCKEDELWILRVNKLVNRMVSENSEETSALDKSSLLKLHKKSIKFVEKT